MAIRLFREGDAGRKRKLQERLTALLPDWFGKAESNEAYARMAEVLDGFVAEVDGTACGLALVEFHGAKSAEIAWMGIVPDRHRSGIGRALCETVVDFCRNRGIKYLFVATLTPDDPYEPYQRTRKFYEAMGFEYVLKEQFPADPNNPAAFYLRLLP